MWTKVHKDTGSFGCTTLPILGAYLVVWQHWVEVIISNLGCSLLYWFFCFFQLVRHKKFQEGLEEGFRRVLNKTGKCFIALLCFWYLSLIFVTAYFRRGKSTWKQQTSSIVSGWLLAVYSITWSISNMRIREACSTLLHVYYLGGQRYYDCSHGLWHFCDRALVF